MFIRIFVKNLKKQNQGERIMLETNTVAIIYLLWFVMAFALAGLMVKISS